jgi:small subunit ribosomal protein S16
VATKIKLMRLGKMRAPYYRIVVADSRTKRDGRVIETIGKYHPKADPSYIEVDSERAQYWLGVGAQPTEPVAAIFKVTGDWQKFRGEPAPAPMKTAAAKPDKKQLFAAAVKDGGTETAAKSDAPRKKSAAKAAAAEPAPEPAPEPAAEPVAESVAGPAAEAAPKAAPQETPDAAAEPSPAPAESGDAPTSSTDAAPEAAGEEPSSEDS